MDAIADHTNNPEFIYQLHPAPLTPQQLGTLYHVARFCRTVYDAIRMICRYFAVASEVVSFGFIERDNSIDLVVIPNRHAYISMHQIEGSLYSLSRRYRFAREYGWFDTRGERLLLEVGFSHTPRFPIDRYAAYFDCPVTFDAKLNYAKLNPKALELSLGHSDDRMLEYFRSLAERYEVNLVSGKSIKQQVQRLFLQRMMFGEPDRQEIAKALSISVRTLLRRLSEEGSSYKEASEQARLMVAKQELESSGLNYDEIAFLLGYSEERAFRRAFIRWTGLTPAEYRRCHGHS